MKLADQKRQMFIFVNLKNLMNIKKWSNCHRSRSIIVENNSHLLEEEKNIKTANSVQKKYNSQDVHGES